MTMQVPALILAAGYGTRLAPLSTVMPKPMIPLPNRDTLLGTIITQLERAGITAFAVNTHYKPEQIEDYLLTRLAGRAHLYHEPDQLGTGGPLVNAKAFLSDADCFVLYNGDILCDVDVSVLIAHHREQGNLVTMLLAEGPEKRILVDPAMRIRDLRGILGKNVAHGKRYSYAGIAVISREFFPYLPEQPIHCDLILSIVEAVRANEKIGGYLLPSDHFWRDLGTVENYLEVAEHLPPVFMDGYDAGAVFKRLAEMGSQRRFYRIGRGGKNDVLMISYPEDADFERFIDFGKYLYAIGAGTPEIYGVNADAFAVLMEDLGDNTLWHAAQNRTVEALDALYRRAANALLDYQRKATENQPEKINGVRVFDKDYLRWETEYFFDNFICGHCKCELSDSERDELFAAFDALAERVDAQPKIWMHRDCQSQNLMVCGERIRFVDFQGGRLGPVGYDLASLLLDPYLELPETVRQTVLLHYADKVAELPGCGKITLADFKTCYNEAAIQRLMQALGAYGFLVHVRGKRQYLDAMPPALERLKQQASGSDFHIFGKILAKINHSALKN